VGALRLLRYRPLFSGPAVERVPELHFQRPEPEVELAPADAGRRGIHSGDTALVRSNGISVALRARVSRALVEGVARIADDHAGDLHAVVEVIRLGASLREPPTGGKA
jgi:anaerobic selenocysteine-containing dehydrogenase